MIKRSVAFEVHFLGMKYHLKDLNYRPGDVIMYTRVDEGDFRCTKCGKLYPPSYVDLDCGRSGCEGFIARVGDTPASAPRRESPCSTCQRMNDIGVKTCWCCGGVP